MSTLDFSQLPGLSIFSLKGKSAIITGGTKGLGLAMAAGLASAGAHVLLVSRKASDGDEAAAEIAAQYGVKAMTFAADVVDQAGMEAMAKFAYEAFGSIDILVNSAGINIRGAIDELSHADFTKVMDVNVTGTWLACRAVTPSNCFASKLARLNPSVYAWRILKRSPVHPPAHWLTKTLPSSPQLTQHSTHCASPAYSSQSKQFCLQQKNPTQTLRKGTTQTPYF